jgi:D-serine deaminase-like pyridoxal phosphate-dependent protein
VADDRIGRRLEEITDTPVLVLDVDVLDRNIAELQAYCDHHGLALWPHAKTHKSPWIAGRQLEAGAHGLTVAKSTEGELLAAAGAARMLLAYPIVGQAKWQRAAALARVCQLSVMLDSAASAEGLAVAARRAGVEIDVLVELEAGLGRVGVVGVAAAVGLAGVVDRLPGLRLAGLGCYPGQLREPDELKVGVPILAELLQAAVDAFDAAGFCRERVSSGSTKTAFVLHEVPSVTESRAGTYVLGDLSDEPPFGMALTVQATVTSQPEPHRVVVDAGAKTLSADVLLRAEGGGFGELLGDPSARLTALFDEHGVVTYPNAGPTPGIGDQVRIVPNHCVAVMNLHDEFLVVRQGAVVDVQTIPARGAVR